MELGLDFGAMFGKGGEFQPLGVFTDKEVEHVDAKTLSNDDLADSNGKITADFPVFVRSKVLAKNVDDNKLGWAFNSVLEGYLTVSYTHLPVLHRPAHQRSADERVRR